MATESATVCTTDEMVDRFAEALKAKLRASEEKHGWNDGWRIPDWQGGCQDGLLEHVDKGDPLDVAAFAAFCWHHGWPTSRGASRAAPGTFPRIPVSAGMQEAGCAELAFSPAGGEARTAGGRALVRAIYRAMRTRAIEEAARVSDGESIDEEAVSAVARALCALGCAPRETDEGRRPCDRCDAHAEPTFRTEARAALRVAAALSAHSTTG